MFICLRKRRSMCARRHRVGTVHRGERDGDTPALHAGTEEQSDDLARGGVCLGGYRVPRGALVPGGHLRAQRCPAPFRCPVPQRTRGIPDYRQVRSALHSWFADALRIPKRAKWVC